VYEDEVEREDEGDDAVDKAYSGDNEGSTYRRSLGVFGRIRDGWRGPRKVDQEEQETGREVSKSLRRRTGNAFEHDGKT
jgi:hypothetical protein